MKFHTYGILLALLLCAGCSSSVVKNALPADTRLVGKDEVLLVRDANGKQYAITHDASNKSSGGWTYYVRPVLTPFDPYPEPMEPPPYEER